MLALNVLKSLGGLLSSIRGERCQVCGTVRNPQQKQGVLCFYCARALRARKGGFCPVCARIYALEDVSPYTCLHCSQTPFPWSKMGFYAPYQGILKDLILDYKFRGDLGLGLVLGDFLARACRIHGLSGMDILVPVPVHPAKLRERGFNQSLELARILARRLRLKISSHGLRKQFFTPAQSSLERKERLKALKGAFAADPEQFCNRSVLLVDDIFTTGSTLDECTRTLFRAGAEDVQVLFLARSV